jgi:hypothetical protein
VLREVNMAAELEAERKLQRMSRNKKALQSSTSSSSSSSAAEDKAESNGKGQHQATATAKPKQPAPKYPPNEFSWVGEPTQTLTRGERSRVYYAQLMKRRAGADTNDACEDKIGVGDFVYISSQAGLKLKLDIKLAVPATDRVDGSDCHIYRVISMFEEQTRRGKKGTMCVHARRMLKGRETVLQEVGGTEELFLSDACDTFAVAHLVRRAEVVYMPPDPHEHPTYDEKETYFYRFHADLDTAAYVTLSQILQFLEKFNIY